MGTRHVIIVVKDHKAKVAQYGQTDGNPSITGVAVLKFIRNLSVNFNIEHFENALNKCKFVDESRQDEMWAEREGSSSETAPYPQISRNTSAGVLDLIMHNTNEVFELVNESDFAHDSSLCEWVYVLDMDTHALKIYRNFNEDALYSWHFKSLPTNEQVLLYWNPPRQKNSC